MNLSEKMLVLENKIIDVLTMFTWWTEVRSDKDNIHWARIFTIVSSLLFAIAFLSELPILYEKKQYFFFWTGLIIGLFQILIFLVEVTFKEFSLDDLKNSHPQGSPNPCRVSKEHSLKRRTRMFFFVAQCLFLIATFSILFLYFSFAILFSCLTEFVLACDSIPPQEKSRRKATNELQDMNLARISN